MQKAYGNCECSLFVLFDFAVKIFYDCWYHSIKLTLYSLLNVLRSLHCMRFSGTSLAIRKNGTVIALNCFINHMVDSTTFINILLRVILWKKMIKMKCSFTTLLVNCYLFFLLVDNDVTIGVPFFDFRGKEGSNSDCCFDFIWH